MNSDKTMAEDHPLIQELREIEAKPMCDEARVLMQLAIEAQKTGKMPDFGKLLTPPTQ